MLPATPVSYPPNLCKSVSRTSPRRTDILSQDAPHQPRPPGAPMPVLHLSPHRYGQFIIFIGGLGGLLYGIDIGIISAALLYLGRTVNLSVAQTSFIVAAVLGGSMISSVIAGLLADWIGRRKMMILAGLMFLSSIGIIFLSHTFVALFSGRLLQGMSGGVIAVVIPLYLAECLSPAIRGRGTAIFQFLLTVGIVLASIAGWFYTRQAEHAIAAAAGSTALIFAAENHAWRSMFLSTVYPGLLFALGTFFLVETPRWLFRTGRLTEARHALDQLATPANAELQWHEMVAIAEPEPTDAAAKPAAESLLQRRYVIPFLLACSILACNQATGINSVLSFLVVILEQAGLTSSQATDGDFLIKLLNCLMTVVAITLVDRKGRRFLLRLGTGGLFLSMLAGAYLFHTFESQRIDERSVVQAAVRGDTLTLPVRQSTFSGPGYGRAMALTVLYSYGHGDRIATVVDSDPKPVLTLAPESNEAGNPLVIKRAQFGPIATPRIGGLVTLCLGVYIAFFSVGPGVVVWLTLSELMPTRIRSTGIGIALLINQGVSTLIAAVFLPTVGSYGFSLMFLFWAACTLVYFLIATFLLPETRGKSLEEIEQHFEGSAANRRLA